MKPEALLLVLASSLAWAALDVLRKRLAARLRPMAAVAALSLGMLPLFLLWLELERPLRFDTGYLAPGAAAVGLNVIANVAFVRALQVAPLSTTIPLLSFTPALAALFSALVLRELPGLSAVSGVVLVVAGALVLHPRAGAAGRPRRLRDDGAALMTGVAFAWSLVVVLDKAALAHASPALHAAAQCAGVGLGALGLLVLRGRARELAEARAVPGTLAAAVFVAALALGLQLLAFQRTYVSSVEALKRTLGMLAALALGRLFFGEPLTPRKWAGVLLMSLGVALILA